MVTTFLVIQYLVAEEVSLAYGQLLFEKSLLAFGIANFSICVPTTVVESGLLFSDFMELIILGIWCAFLGLVLERCLNMGSVRSVFGYIYAFQHRCTLYPSL